MHQNRTLIRGDNLTEMRNFPDECIDLIATDPPFNSKRDYFVPYRDEQGREPGVLVKAFTDTWNWGIEAEMAYDELVVGVGGQIGDSIEGLRKFLKDTPMMAYLVMMAIRIVEMHRILNSTGSLYLHCDPTASHYLKIILDAVFGPQQFRNEIIWHYYNVASVSKRFFGRKHDTIFFYSLGNDAIFNDDDMREPYTENSNWVRSSASYGDDRYRPNPRGKRMHDVWRMPTLNNMAEERTSYPTQKPIELYKRIVLASSSEDGLVLDPFCGCGTTLMAAEGLNRRWIGIDLTYLATGAVKLQIEKYFPQLQNQVTIAGTPESLEQALELARTDPHGFEQWAVTHVLKFKANVRGGGDGGIDGTMRFPLGREQGRQAYGTVVAQIKAGTYTLSQIRDFRTAMENEEAEMGVFLVTTSPTDGMLAEAAKSGMYEHPSYEFTAPRLQIYQIQDYYNDVLPKLPHAVRDVL